MSAPSYYRESSGKRERWHRAVTSQCLRLGTPLSLEDARRLVGEFVEFYDTVRLHSAIGYITSQDKLHGNETKISREKDRKLKAARERRKQKRQKTNQEGSRLRVPNQLTYDWQLFNSG
jgi:putative transposase